MIELLVVMIVIGVLAAIAIPIFVHQRGKAHDSSTQSDVSNLGREIATHFVNHDSAPNLDFDSDPDFVILSGGSTPVRVRLSNGTARPAFGSSSNLGDRDRWCVSLVDTSGLIKQFRFSARSGLEAGTCADTP